MRVLLLVLVGLGFGLASGCGDDDAGGDAGLDGGADAEATDDAGGDVPGEDGGEDGAPGELPTGQCGSPEHAWVAPAELGEIVALERVEDWSLTAGAINLVLATMGQEALADCTYDVVAYRVRYVTQDRGEPIESTAILSYPVVDPGTEVPIVLWTHGTSGFTDACAPSGGDLEDAAANVLFAGHGVAVAAPDYLGMNGFGEPAPFLHPYLVPEATAVASLDSVRALRRLAADEELDAVPDPSRTVIWGASEGGFAAVWSDRYAPRYLPEITVVGTVAAVPPLDLLGLAQHGLSVFGDTTGALAAALTTMNLWYGEPAPLSQALTDEPPINLASVIAAELHASCSDFPAVESVTAIDQVYQDDFITAVTDGDWASAEPFSCYLRTGTLRHADVPRENDVPLLVIEAENDELVVAAPNRDEIPELCGQGYDIEYVECAGAAHTEGAVQSLPYQWRWVQERLDGEPFTGPCTVGAPVDCTAL